MSVLVRAQPDDATAVFDGKPLVLPATLSRPPGTRATVLVSRPGFKDRQVELEFTPGAGEVLVKLEPESQPTKPAPTERKRSKGAKQKTYRRPCIYCDETEKVQKPPPP